MRPLFLITAVLIMLAGCASGPPNQYYTLSAVEAGQGTIGPARVTTLNLEPVHLPGVTDRPQLVIRTGPQTVEIREFDRWAEPLDEMVTRTLAQDLASRQIQDSDKSGALLSVAVDEFMADAAGQVHLTGRWWVDPKKIDEGSFSEAHAFSLAEPADAHQMTQSVATMSALLGKLADSIAHELADRKYEQPG